MARFNARTSLSLVLFTALTVGCSGADDKTTDSTGPALGEQSEDAQPQAGAGIGQGGTGHGGPSNAGKAGSGKLSVGPEGSGASASAPAGSAESEDPRAADPEGDGVPADRDLCPNTPEGEPVDETGCSASQRGERGTRPPTQAMTEAERAQMAREAASLVTDGEVRENGFASFVLDPTGAFPVVLKTLADNVKPLEDGFELSGTVLIEVPGGEHVSLFEAIVRLEYDAQKGEGLQRFEGTARVPFPKVGVLSNAEIHDPAVASVGYDAGANLTHLDAPLDAARKYFYFTFSAGLEATVGDVSISAGPGQSMTIALDPSDPSFFGRAALSGLMGPVEDASFGFSVGGHLPFTPENTWGIDAHAAAFSGHLWLGGKVSLDAVKLPLSIGGNTVIDVDPDDDGRTVFEDPAQGYRFGSNSELDLSLDAAALALEVPISEATIVGQVGKTGQSAYYSGRIHAGNDWLSGVVPIEQSVALTVAGHVSSDVTASYLQGQGDFSLDASTLGGWTGLSLNDLAVMQANLRIDESGVLLKGTASASLSPVIGLNGDAVAEAFFNGKPEAWYVTLDGHLVVRGVSLSADAHARLDRNGLNVRGSFVTPLSSVAMAGGITRSGVDVRGSASVTIPIVAGREIVQQVTDAAVCGTETIADAAVCGTEIVSNGALCGYKTVTSAALCGVTTVTSAAQCGTRYVQDGALCGTRTITSGAQCGVDYVSCGFSCIASGFSDCTCEKPKTCSVPKSCAIAATCQVAASCNIPNTCSVPATCERVKTCEQRVTVPDFDYGTVRGSIELAIGDSGLKGKVRGQYCPTSGSCIDVAGGRIDLSSGAARACITVPNVQGEFCAAF